MEVGILGGDTIATLDIFNPKLHVVSEAARDSVFCGRIYFGDTCPYPESLCKIRPGMACRTSDTRTHGKAAKGPVYDIEVCYFGWKK